MFEDVYKSMNSRIGASSGLVEDTIERAKAISKPAGQKRKRPLLRIAVTAAALITCISVSMPVLAAYVPAVYELMYLVSPEIAQYFVPVQESCEDNGIRMEVVSAYIHGNKAEIYITIQDLTSDRIDGTTDLFDSYDIHRAFSSSASCRLAGYDAQTKTAAFLILIEEWGDREIAGSKLTFSLREFLSHKTSAEGVGVDIPLSGIESNAKTQKVYLNGWDGIDPPLSGDEAAALVPQEAICSPLKGLDVTAAGYVDGRLHIQLATTEKLTLDPHGYFYLADGSGGQRLYDYSFSFTEEADTGVRTDYQEFVFDIPQDELDRYKLYGNFYTAGMRTAGDWRITFPLVLNEE